MSLWGALSTGTFLSSLHLSPSLPPATLLTLQFILRFSVAFLSSRLPLRPEISDKRNQAWLNRGSLGVSEPNNTAPSDTDHVPPVFISALRSLFLLTPCRPPKLPCQRLCAKVRAALQLPADVLLFLLLFHFHCAYSVWQSTTQSTRWAGWNGGNG